MACANCRTKPCRLCKKRKTAAELGRCYDCEQGIPCDMEGPGHMKQGRPLNTREMSACLTGLRLLMAWRNTNGRNAMCALDVDLDDAQVLDILTSGGEFTEPDQEFLDNLCVNLNCGEIEVSDGLLEDLAKAASGKPKRRRKS